MYRFALILPLLISFIVLLQAFSVENTEVDFTGSSDPPEELGKVTWLRSFPAGLKLAAKEKKPVFLLFQEVPGCSTCRNYGRKVLSHPLLVEAIETHFVPVAIYNNEGGADKKVLKYYGEPAWNNPVVRIVNHEKENLVPRVSGNYSELGVLEAIIAALKMEGKEIPQYLTLLEKEWMSQQKGTERATVSMYCFWSGEKKLGNLEGVVATQPGFMQGREVVQIDFDPKVISYEDLLDRAKKMSCAQHVYTETSEQELWAEGIVGENAVSEKSKFRLDHEPKYYLSKTNYQYVPMTPLQATKVNSRVGNGQSPNALLSPRQLEVLEYTRQHPKKKWSSAINVDLRKAWDKVEGILKNA